MSPNPANHDDLDARRKRARRTAWIVGGIAVLVYVVFLLMGVLGR